VLTTASKESIAEDCRKDPDDCIVKAMWWREFVQRFGLVMKSLDDQKSDR